MGQRTLAMDGLSGFIGRVADLIAVAIFAVLALAVTILWTAGVLQAVIVIPFLLLIPGYAVVSALFPQQAGPFDLEIPSFFEQAFLAVTTSIALAILVGINLEFTQWLIRPQPVVTVLTAISLVSVAIAGYRRWQIGDHSYSFDNDSGLRGPDAKSGGTGTRLASLAVVVAVLTAVLSVGVVAMDPPRGEKYTEFGLLTELDDGSLVADEYPEEITLGESEDLHFTVTNQEKQLVEYTVVVTLSDLNEDGEPIKRAELNTYRNSVAAGETWQREHSVRPVIEGENLRLTYLLYKSPKPAQPTAENSYRNLHIWIDVPAN